MKLYKKWLLENAPESLALKLTKLAVDKSKYYRRAKKLRDNMAGKHKINPKNAHELNVLQAKMNRIDKILYKYGQKRYQ
jgi:hypothetical protein